MEFEPSPELNPNLEQISSSFVIEQGDNKFILNMKSNEQCIILEISEENMLLDNYEKKLNITDINNTHKIFYDFILFKEFFDYIKAQIEDKKVEIFRTSNEKISIKLKQENIDIILNKKKLNNDVIIRKICEEMKATKITLKNIELKYEKIILENSKMNQEIKILKAINKKLMKENKEIKNNIKQLKKENEYLKEPNINLESKIDTYKSIDDEIKYEIKEENKQIKPVIKNIIEENTNNQNKFSYSEKSKNEHKFNPIKKINKLNLDNINNNTNNDIENIKPLNTEKNELNRSYVKKRIKSFCKRDNTLKDLKCQTLDIIKVNEQFGQNKFKKFNKRNEFENIKEEDYFNDEDNIIDRDLNSLNINLNQISQLYKEIKSTLSCNDISIKEIFNKNITKNKNLNNSPKNGIYNFLNNTLNNKNIGNINNKYLHNVIINDNDERKFNIKYNTINKENIENKIRNNSSDYKLKEIYKKNLTELNHNFNASPINNHYKKIRFFEPSPKKFNNKTFQNFDLNTKYKINTEYKQHKSNKTYEDIHTKAKNLLKSNENKQEKNQMINSMNRIFKPNNSFYLNKNYNLNNCANVLIYAYGSHFINATLQCLANIKQLVEYFLYNKREKKASFNEKLLSNAFLEIMENLWENKSIKGYIAINFINIINKQFLLSSKELITFILDTLHQELNKSENNKPDFYLQYFGNDFDKYFQNFEKYYQKNFQSIISDLFYQKCDCKINCYNCNTLSHQIYLTNILTFSLEKVKEFNNINKKYISINDCFKYFKNSEYEIIKCTKCKKEDFLGIINNLLVASKVLIIYIDRINKLENKIVIDEEIDLSNYFYYKKNGSKYELISIMTFLEDDQFIAFCKSFVDNKWYKYEDSKVTQSSFKEVKSKGYPELLFYSLKE